METEYQEDKDRALRLARYKARIHESNEQIIVKLESAYAQAKFSSMKIALDECMLLIRAYDKDVINEQNLRNTLLCMREAMKPRSEFASAIYDLTHEMIFLGVDTVSISELLGISA